MTVQLSLGTLTDADLWNLKQALATAQAPAAPGAPTPPSVPSPPSAPPPPPAGGRNVMIPLAWGAPGSGNVRVFTRDYGGFRDSDVVILSFTTPNGTSSGIGAIQAAEFQSPAISRTASLSPFPGSFDNDLGGHGFAGQPALVSGNTVTVSYQVGPAGIYPSLKPATTYYFNIKNTSGVGGDLVIELIKPPGL